MEHPLADDAPTKTVSGKLGRYELVKRLATGGTADLLLARTSGGGLERHLVIKQLHDDPAKDAAFVKTFITEARRASGLRHRNIVQVQDVGEAGGKPYVAMEYVHGEDLRKLLTRLRGRNQVIPLPHLVAIGTSVAAALHHAHEQAAADRKPLGIVHGGVTPADVLVGYDGNVKLVDFGITKAALQTIETRTEGLEGKIPYMAPEQCTGHEVDRRSDVFALGVVLYELATARRLFKGESEFLTMAAIVAGTVPRPSLHRKDLPGEIENVIMKALSRAPADRYQTAAELRTALDGYALKAKVTYSGSALAGYMAQLFGKRPEPWLGNAEGTALTVVEMAVSNVDFDGAAVGLAEPPAEAVEMFAIPDGATNDSPIAHAHGRAVTEVTETEKPTAVVSLGIKEPAVEASAPAPRPAPKTSPPRPAPKTSPPRPASSTSPPRPAPSTSPPRPASSTSPPRPASSTSPPRPTPNGELRKLEPSGRPSKPEVNEQPAASSAEANRQAAAPSSEQADPASGKTEVHRLPPPVRTSRPIPITTPVSVAPPVAAVTAPAAEAPQSDRMPTDVVETTRVANPPPPPPVVVASATSRKSGVEPTEIVAPLPSPLNPAKRAARASTPPALGQIESEGARSAALSTTDIAVAARRTWIKAGLIGAAGAIAAVILVLTIGFSSDDVTATPPPVRPEPTAATPPEAQPPIPAPEPPRAERTWRNSQPPDPPSSESTAQNAEAPSPSEVTAHVPAEPAPAPPRPEGTARNAEPAPEPSRAERTWRNSQLPSTSEVAAQVPAEPPARKPAPAASAPPPPSRPPSPPTPLAPSPPKRTRPPETTHAVAQTAKPAARPPETAHAVAQTVKPVAKPPIKPPAKPPAKAPDKPAKSPAYDPDALFLKKP